MLAKPEESWLLAGHITRPFGLKGELKISLSNPYSANLRKGIPVLLVKDRKQQVLDVLGVKSQGQVICLSDVVSCEDAETWRGAQLHMRRQDWLPLSEDEVYLADCADAPVFDTHGACLGSVCGFSDNRAQILIEVKTPNDQKVLVPFVSPILVDVQRSPLKIVLDPPLGLF